MTTQQILQGVHDWTNGKIVYDISVAHPDGQGKPTPYADLAAALGTGGANIPEGLRKGGMSVKFIKGSVQSSDNKYVQYRYMSDDATTVTTFTNPDNWQGVDDEPTAGSENLVKSGGIAKSIPGNLNDDSPSDLSIGDSDGNVILELKGGNVKTKNFDSQNLNGELNDDSPSDLSIGDSDGNVILELSKGNIRTKNFNSAELSINTGTNLAPIKNIGCQEIQMFKDSYNIIAAYGQSLSVGVSSSAVTTGTIEGAYMLGSNVRDIESTQKNLLKAVGAEDFVVATGQAIRYLFMRDGKDAQNILATSSGVGGASINQCLNDYYNRFEAHLTNAKSMADAENKSIVCPIIVFCQGEDESERETLTKEQYKAKLIELKNKMQNSCMSILEQSYKPLFFVTMPGGRWSSRARKQPRKQSLNVHMAELEACIENPDMVLAGSSYFVSDFCGRHLCANGYRWLGEYIAKLIYQTDISKVLNECVYPLKVSCKSRKIILETNGKTPLVSDTQLVLKKQYFGFSLRANTDDIFEIKKIESIGNTISFDIGNLLVKDSSLDLANNLTNNVIQDDGTLSGTSLFVGTTDQFVNIGKDTPFSVLLTSGYYAKIFYYSSNSDSTCVGSTDWFEDGTILKAIGDYMLITIKKNSRGTDVVPLSEGSGIVPEGTDLTIITFNLVDKSIDECSNVILTYCQDTAGEGNIHDTDSWLGRLLYVDDSNEVSTLGQDEAHVTYIPPITGAHYPCYNWLSPFSIKLN